MRSMRFTLLALIMVVIVIAVGCARKHTYVAPGGKVTVNEKGGKAKSVVVQTKEGKATIQVEKKSITEAELGAPVYPGATVEMSGNYEGMGGKTESMQQNMLTTPDDFDKVFQFYKTNLKNVKNTVNQDMGAEKMAMFSATSAAGSELSIHIMTDKAKKVTRIQVVKVKKGK